MRLSIHTVIFFIHTVIFQTLLSNEQVTQNAKYPEATEEQKFIK